MPETVKYIDRDKYDFDIGDPMLCYFGTMLYQATCLNRRYSEEYGVEYKVHYEGWKKCWDEWLEERRALEVNPTNLAHLERIERQHKEKLRKAKVLNRCFNGIIPTKKVVQKPKKRGRPPKRKYKNTKALKTSNSSTVTVDVADTSDDDTINKPNKKTKIDTITMDDDIIITKSSNTVIATKTNYVASMSNCSISNIDYNNELAKITEYYTKFSDDQSFIVVYPRKMHICRIVPCIDIPSKLRNVLIYDWIMNNTHRYVVKIPTKISVGGVICDYIESKTKKETNGITKDRAAIFGLSILEYFNYLVLKHLLHKNELKNNMPRKALSQFTEKCKDGNIQGLFFAHLLTAKKVWCYIYGPTHLLRLFVDIRSHLERLRYNGEDRETTLLNVRDFLMFLEENMDLYFTDDYVNIQSGYICI